LQGDAAELTQATALADRDVDAGSGQQHESGCHHESYDLKSVTDQIAVAGFKVPR
ncbi:MAG: hypothetical protein JWL72_926, partial [Ilumatobacteraceae bacterium]|nr:hypothetical protein [Ilumatobacteraceae bacterium]